MGTFRHVVSVEAPVEEVFESWCEFTDLSEHFDLLQSVEELEADLLSWDYVGPLGKSRSARVLITEIIPNRIVAWRSNDDASLAGSVAFEAAGDETYMTFVLSFNPPAGRIGDIISGMLGFPEGKVKEGLMRFKRGVESQ